MLKYLAAAAVVLVSTSAFAQSTSTTTAGSESYAGSQSGVNLVQNSARTASSAIAPGLIASGLSCSGSASIGGAGGGWGLSLGITKEDRYCNAREDAKYIHGVTGDTGAAKERLCDIMENRRAFARAGRPCAVDRQRVVRSAQTIRHTSSAGYATTRPARRALTMRD